MSTNNNKAHHNHLFKLPNTVKNRELIDRLRREMVKAESKWRLDLKGRRPIWPARYGNGGNLRLEDAEEFAVYLRPRDREQRYVAYESIPESVSPLEAQVATLKNQVKKLELQMHTLLGNKFDGKYHRILEEV